MGGEGDHLPSATARPRLRRWLRFGPLNRRIFSLAMPAVVEQICHMALGIIDTRLVASLGRAAVAAVGIGDQLMQLCIVAFAAFNIGTTAVVARAWGAHREHEAAAAAGQSLLVVSAVGGLLALAGRWLALPGVALMGATADTLPLAGAYLSMVVLSIPAMGALMVCNASMRGAGDTRTPLYITLGMNAIHLVFSYVLIFGRLGLPAFGVVGAAISSIMARWLGAAIALFILVSGRGRLRLQRPWAAGLDPVIIRRILQVGIPAALEQLVMRLGQMSYFRIVASLGTAAVAAHRLALQAESLSFSPGMGFGVAATTLVGQGLGARKPKFAEASAYQTFRMASLVMGSMGIAFVLWPEAICRFFIDDAEVVALGASVLRIVGLAQPGLALTMVTAGALRGAGDTRWTLAITMFGIWLVRVPVAYLLVVWLNWGLVGAWIAMSVDLWVRGLSMLMRFRSGGWKRIVV